MIGNRRKMIQFEERDIKHRVNFHGCGELQSVGLGANSFDTSGNSKRNYSVLGANYSRRPGRNF